MDGSKQAGVAVRDVVLDLVQRVAHGEHAAAILAIGKPVALEAKAEDATDARVHLDDDDAAVLGVDGKLHVGAAAVSTPIALQDGDGRRRAGAGSSHVGEGLRREPP